MSWEKVKNFLLDLLFPKFCFGCQREGTFLCQDCLSTIEIFRFHKKLKTKFLDDLFVATEYKNAIVKKMILSFKYDPFVKELKKDLANLIKVHFQLLDEKFDFSDFVLIPIPLDKKRLRWRGFNQAQEIGKELANFFKIPLISDCLVKKKSTLPQAELSEKERKENLKGAFIIEKKVRGKKILLIDDVFTTGATMEEAAKTLKEAGAEKVVGIVVAIAKPGDDKLTL